MLNEPEHSLDEYRNILLDHATRPRNLGFIEKSHHLGFCRNPACGDSVCFSLLLDQDEIKDIRVRSLGCSMAIASASLLGEFVKNRKTIDIIETLKVLRKVLSERSENHSWPKTLHGLNCLSPVQKNPARLACVLVGVGALENALSEQKKSSPQV